MNAIPRNHEEQGWGDGEIQLMAQCGIRDQGFLGETREPPTIEADGIQPDSCPLANRVDQRGHQMAVAAVRTKDEEEPGLSSDTGEVHLTAIVLRLMLKRQRGWR